MIIISVAKLVQFLMKSTGITCQLKKLTISFY